jgi:hypothetical protein
MEGINKYAKFGHLFACRFFYSPDIASLVTLSSASGKGGLLILLLFKILFIAPQPSLRLSQRGWSSD